MANNISNEDVHKALIKVMHPVIERNLIDLGIIKDIVIDGNMVMIIMAFPFIGIPVEHIAIRKQIVNSVREQVEMLGAKVQLKLTEMSNEEFQNFLAMERETWNSIMKN